MNASKENAGQAMRDLETLRELWVDITAGQDSVFDECWTRLNEFLQSAEKRLPTEGAIQKDKARKRNYHVTKRKPARAQARSK